MQIYEHWRLEQDADKVYWAWLNCAERSTNTLSPAVLREFGQLLDDVAAARPPGLVIISAKDNGFIAGADIEEFKRITDVEDAEALIWLGQQVFDKLENLGLPTVAAISGFCLGGGLELALACRYRVVDDGSKTRLGLPEVMLGIYPGWGGITRLPRLVGSPAALDLLLTGRTLDARRARKLGLADVAAPRRQLQQAARALVLHAPPPRRLPLWQRLLDSPLGRSLLVGKVRQQVAARARPEHYPAPYAIIELWQHHGGDPTRLPREAPGSIASLLTGMTARNLMRVFGLQERLKGLAKESARRFHHVHVVGAGVMGGDIAIWCVLRGLTVTLQDQSLERLVPVMRRAREVFDKRLREPRAVRSALDRLIPDVRGDGVRRADVVIEAIFENLEAKQALFRSIEPKLRPDAILASNTSSIPLEAIATVLRDPARLVGLHFFNPVEKMMLVEIVYAKQTHAEMVHASLAFARAIDKLPLPVKSSPGFLVNRVLAPYLLEAMLMLDEGISPEQIDESALAFGMPMGPVELADTVGLDICTHVGASYGEIRPVQQPKKLAELVAAKKFGRKVGAGFYVWKNGKAVKVPGARASDEITQRLVLPYLNECVACLSEELVRDAELLDAGLVFGTGFAPFRGGPMSHIQAVGAPVLLAQLQQLSQRYGERFAPHAGWNSFIDEGST